MQYWKQSSVKEPRNAAEPLKSNKYVALELPNTPEPWSLSFSSQQRSSKPAPVVGRVDSVIKLVPRGPSVFLFLRVLAYLCVLLSLRRQCVPPLNTTPQAASLLRTAHKVPCFLIPALFSRTFSREITFGTQFWGFVLCCTCVLTSLCDTISTVFSTSLFIP